MSSRNCVQVIHKKKGMKALMKKLEYLNEYQATSGIHKDKGRRKITSGDGKKRRNKSINMATLAKVLETDHDIIPTRDIYLISQDGNATIKLTAGKSYHHVARYFIKLQNVPEEWNKVREFIRRQFLEFLGFSGRGKREGAYIFRRIGEFAETIQRSQIIDAKTAPNTAATSILKGKNHPLLDDGDLLNSIDHRVSKQSTGRKVRFSKIADDMEKTMMSLNK